MLLATTTGAKATDYVLNATTCASDKVTFTTNDLTFTLDPAHGGNGTVLTGTDMPVKYTKNKTYTITLPSNLTISNVHFAGYTNSDTATDGAILKINGNDVSGFSFEATKKSTAYTEHDFPISQTGGTFSFTTANTNQIGLIITFTGTAGGSTPQKTDVTLAFNNPTTTVQVGNSVTNTVTTTPTGVTGVTYASGNIGIATVNSSTGEVTGVSEGTTTITASYAGNDTYNAATDVSYQITVTSAGGGETPATELTAVTTHTWDFSDWTVTSYAQSATETVVNNLGILPSSAAIAVDENSKTIDDFSFTKRLKLGATGSASSQNVHFKVAGRCNITVYGMSSKSGNARTLGMTIGSTEVQTYTNDGTAIGKMEYAYSGSAADVYLYSQSSGFNLYAIVVEGVEPEPVHLYFDDGMSTTVEVGATVTNAVTSEPAVSPITYASSNTNVATVDNNGTVTGVSVGTATITASFAGNDSYAAASDSYTINVTAATTPSTLSAVSDYIWKFNNWDVETYTQTVVDDNLEIVASSSKAVDINSKSGTADNIAFTKICKLGGAGSAEGRYVHVKVAADTKVTVYATTGKDGTERTINIATGAWDNVVSTFTSSSTSTIASGSINCSSVTDVYVYSAGSGINLYGIKVESTSGGGSGPAVDETTTTPAVTGATLTDVVNNTVAQNSKANQLKVILNDGNINYYNTNDISNVANDKELGKVTITMKNGSSDIYYATVANISFAKKVEEESGGTVSGSLTITEAKGWYESAYVKFTPVSGASYYNVYVKGGQYSSYTKIDDELVRNYGTYGRADAVGLMAGTYSIKVVAVSGNTETSTYGEATGLTVKNYSREGFAHKGYSGVGAYNDDGTLKSGARVIYITKNTAKTVSCDIVTSSKGATTHYTGWQAILGGYEKGYESTPTTFRIIGTIDKADLDGINSSEEGLQIKGKGYTTMNITIEGIGDDANTRGFGFLIRGCTSVELRNFANMLCMDDAVSMNTDNSHIWVHNLDLFYGAAGSAADQVKGDGTVDLKDDTQWITIDHNHFWDNGKSSLCGMKSESGPNYITYHHNWFDHSDSRHPRIRTMSVHIWNNYFDGNSKYGVGATYGCSAFVDRNYFRNCKIPMMSSKQGTDAKGDGTFSGENGGMIKSYGNVRTGSSASNYIPHTSNSTSFDAYEASSPTEQVPSSYKTVQGGTTYDNFDTNSSVMYSYTPDSANDIPTIIKGDWGAGRMNHGDFSWTFNNSTEDTNYSIITELKSALSSYATKLVGWFK